MLQIIIFKKRKLQNSAYIFINRFMYFRKISLQIRFLRLCETGTSVIQYS